MKLRLLFAVVCLFNPMTYRACEHHSRRSPASPTDMQLLVQCNVLNHTTTIDVQQSDSLKDIVKKFIAKAGFTKAKPRDFFVLHNAKILRNGQTPCIQDFSTVHINMRTYPQ